MKHRYNLYILIFILSAPLFDIAQAVNTDTVNSKTRVYEVKKKNETIFKIAAKLNLDVLAISLLNDSIATDKILEPGQKIIIPISPVSASSGKRKKGHEPEAGPQANSRNENPPSANRSAVRTEAPLDTELIENRILLADATLDLNKALLQGVQASLDSLNVKDKVLIDEKNISATIHHMQRQRDKAMLTPVLLHMQDSLQTEIKREENEKAGFEKMLGRNGPPQQKTDTIATSKVVTPDTGSLAVTMKVDSTPPKPIEAELKPAAAKNDTAVEVSANLTVNKVDKTDNGESGRVRPVIEANASSEVTSPPPITHWETAKAIYFNDDTPDTGTIVATQKASDTAGYNPDSKDINNMVANPISDSSRVIRARYFFTKAMKASNEKNFRVESDYLRNAIDLSPKYYDAWFALGEADAHQGFYTKAMYEFIHCKTIDSSSASLYYKIGVVQLKLKQRTEAMQNFNRALKLDSNYVPAIISRAGEYAERNQLRAAIKEYGRVIEIDPTYHTVYKPKAMAEYSLQSYAAAVDDFSRFLIFNETDGSVYYYRGLAKLKLRSGALIDACTDFSVSARLGYHAALKAMEANCK